MLIIFLLYSKKNVLGEAAFQFALVIGGKERAVISRRSNFGRTLFVDAIRFHQKPLLQAMDLIDRPTEFRRFKVVADPCQRADSTCQFVV